VTDGPWDLKFEVDFDTNPSATASTWTDLSERVKGDEERVDVQLGLAGSPSSATLVLNNRDRALDPTNTGATHNLVPMRHARLSVTYDETSYPLFRGYVEDWPPVWPEYNQGLVSVNLTDALTWVALIEMDVDLPRQRSGERIAALLDLADWPADRRSLDTGNVMVDAVEQESANLLQLMIDASDAEDGWLYTSKSGDVTFHDRHHILEIDASITFGPDGHKIAGVNPRYGSRTIINRGRVELANGDVVEITDGASIDAYGPSHPWTARDLPMSVVEAEALATWWVVRYAGPVLELDGVHAHGHSDQGAPIPDLLSVGLGDRGDFSHTPPGGGTAEMEGVVRAQRYEFRQGSVAAFYDLVKYHGAGPWLRFDDATAGFDVGRFAP